MGERINSNAVENYLYALPLPLLPSILPPPFEVGNATLTEGESLLLLVPREKQKLGKDISRRMSNMLENLEPRSKQGVVHQ